MSVPGKTAVSVMYSCTWKVIEKPPVVGSTVPLPSDDNPPLRLCPQISMGCPATALEGRIPVSSAVTFTGASYSQPPFCLTMMVTADVRAGVETPNGRPERVGPRPTRQQGRSTPLGPLD